MKEFVLKTAHKCFAAGEAFLIKNNNKPGSRSRGSSDAECSAFEEAVSVLERELNDAASQESGDNAAIYEAEGLLLSDEGFREAVRKGISDEGLNASSAVRKAGKELSEKLERSDSEYIRERSEDIRGLSDRLISIMEGGERNQLSKPSVIVSEELSPAVLSSLDRTMIRGIITAKGAPASHLSILAGNMGVPYLYGSRDAVQSIEDGDRLILDGERVLVDPDDEAWNDAVNRTPQIDSESDHRESESPSEKCRTKICANITGPEEAGQAVSKGADGVGLFRSEFLFLTPSEEPSEERQFEAYRKAAEALQGRELVVRTMDLGSDKVPSWLSLPSEKNPALGLRGVRLSLMNERLFKVQLRALMRAAVYGNLYVMLPMVTSPWEVDEVRALMRKCGEELSSEGTEYRVPSLGVMIETPAAVEMAEELSRKADFFSIGTNDLTQYTLALDREEEGLDRFYDSRHEAVFRMITRTVKAGHDNNIPVSVCGEMAGDPEAIPRLIEARVDALSVSSSRLYDMRKQVLIAEKDDSQKAFSDNGFAIASPADGQLIPMEEIPDEAFSTGSLGSCIGVMPENGFIYAPCDGVVSSIAETKHALTISSDDGRSLLIHAGIDTVKLGGKGMKVLVSVGDCVSAGQKVMEVDIDLVQASGLSPVVIVADCS